MDGQALAWYLAPVESRSGSNPAQEERTQGAGEVPRAQRIAQEDVEGEGNSGPSDNRRTRCGNSQARRMAVQKCVA